MNYTGKQLVELGIITGAIPTENIAQHGVDLNLIEVRRIVGDEGFIPSSSDEKTKLATRKVIELSTGIVYGKVRQVWNLLPGAYDITFAQGCVIPPNQSLEIFQRSSLLRNGAILRSSVFDAGFYTSNIGTVIILMVPLTIEYGARVAQICSKVSNVVENLYNGQYQNDKQRGNTN